MTLSWFTSHSDSGNEGFLDVGTAPAGGGWVGAPDLGMIGGGVGPVCGADGTVFIGNSDGRMFALHADGTLAWSRDTAGLGTMAASPVVTADGSVFAVTTRRITRDHRPGAPPSGIRDESYLHRFTPSGDWSFTSFPERDRITGTAMAPLNIWRQDAVEVLMIPVVYRVLSTTEIWILAFSSGGQFLGDALVTRLQDSAVTGEGIPFAWPTFPHFDLAGTFSFPGVAIFKNPAGGTPWVLVSDVNHALVSYTFALDGSAGRFTEHNRFQNTKLDFSAPPMVPLFDGHTRIGTRQGKLLSAGPIGGGPSPIDLSEPIYAAPTRTADDRLVVVTKTDDWEGTMSVVRGGSVLSRTKLPGGSAVSPAASRSHVFVSARSALVTYDANTMAEVARLSWPGSGSGGFRPPVIGPLGHVYALAWDQAQKREVLYVFRPPRVVHHPPTPL
jgi:hypothetical protein